MCIPQCKKIQNTKAIDKHKIYNYTVIITVINILKEVAFDIEETFVGKMRSSDGSGTLNLGLGF